VSNVPGISAHLGGTYASGHAEMFVPRSTNILEWRCLDQIRALIQEWCVAYLPN
jgi:hypothetical protein